MEARWWVSAHLKGLPCCAFGRLSLGQLRSVAAFWQSGDKGIGSQQHCYHGASTMLAQRLWSFLGSNCRFNDPKMTIEHNTVKFPLQNSKVTFAQFPSTKMCHSPLIHKTYLPSFCPEPPCRQRYLVGKVEVVDLTGRKYEETVYLALRSAHLTTDE